MVRKPTRQKKIKLGFFLTMVIPVSVLIHPKGSLPACLPRVKLALLVESSFGCPVAGTFSFPSHFLAGWFEVFCVPCNVHVCGGGGGAQEEEEEEQQQQQHIPYLR
jgi:hypothetical protein